MHQAGEAASTALLPSTTKRYDRKAHKDTILCPSNICLSIWERRPFDCSMLQSHSSAQAAGLSRPAAVRGKQQRRFRRHALHTPAIQHSRTSLNLLAAASTLQDLQIKPFQPTEQQELHSDSSSTHLKITPVCEWATDAVLMAG